MEETETAAAAETLAYRSPRLRDLRFWDTRLAVQWCFRHLWDNCDPGSPRGANNAVRSMQCANPG